jgi:hypothetical protein
MKRWYVLILYFYILNKPYRDLTKNPPTSGGLAEGIIQRRLIIVMEGTSL